MTDQNSDGSDRQKILNALCWAGPDGISKEEIADRTGLDQSDVAPLLDDLEENGAVTRVGLDSYDLTGLGAIFAEADRSVASGTNQNDPHPDAGGGSR